MKRKTVSVWFDLLEGTLNPLLSCHAGREFTRIPEHFPQPIAKVNVCTSKEAQSTPPLLSFTNAMSPARVRVYNLKECSDVLVPRADLHNSPLQPMTGQPVRIHLREDTTPFIIHTPQQIPAALRERVKTELESVVAQEIMAPTGDEPSPRCHPLAAAAKHSGGT